MRDIYIHILNKIKKTKIKIEIRSIIITTMCKREKHWEWDSKTFLSSKSTNTNSNLCKFHTLINFYYQILFFLLLFFFSVNFVLFGGVVGDNWGAKLRVSNWLLQPSNVVNFALFLLVTVHNWIFFSWFCLVAEKAEKKRR